MIYNYLTSISTNFYENLLYRILIHAFLYMFMNHLATFKPLKDYKKYNISNKLICLHPEIIINQ